jgi:serine/threonine protein kinase
VIHEGHEGARRKTAIAQQVENMSTTSSDLIRLKLEADGLGNLFEPLSALTGLTLGERFVLRELYAVGGQSLLWRTEDREQPERPALTRLALLPYPRPAYIRDADIHRARRRIEHEAQLLQRFHDSSLPQCYGLYYAPNPLQSPERGPAITDTEPYLVMEWIRGVTVTAWARMFATGNLLLTGLALDIARTFIELSLQLQQGGYLYTDLNPHNLIYSASEFNRPVRVIDAGSIIPLAPSPDFEIPFSWAYVPPDYYDAYNAGKRRWPTAAFALYTLGKTLWQVLTNRQPMPGEPPDLKDATFLEFPLLTPLVGGLLTGRYTAFDQLEPALQSLTESYETLRKAP